MYPTIFSLCVLLQSYLIKYGYIPPEESGSAAYRTKEYLEDAIRSFQKMANLPMTGKCVVFLGLFFLTL